MRLQWSGSIVDSIQHSAAVQHMRKFEIGRARRSSLRPADRRRGGLASRSHRRRDSICSLDSDVACCSRRSSTSSSAGEASCRLADVEPADVEPAGFLGLASSGGQEAECEQLAYPEAGSYTIGDEIILQPVVAQNVVAFSVEPYLPAGLALDPYTGVISGRALEAVAEKVYKVTAWSDDDDCSACVLTLQIEPPPQQVALDQRNRVPADACNLSSCCCHSIVAVVDDRQDPHLSGPVRALAMGGRSDLPGCTDEALDVALPGSL